MINLPQLVFVLSALSGPGPQTAEDPMSDGDAIRMLLERFVDAWNRADAEAAVAVYTDPHVDVNAPVPLETRDETRARWKAFFERYDTHIAVTSDDLIMLGAWAFQRGELEQSVTPKGGGATITLRRRYVEVLNKVDGVWRVFWGMDAPVAEGRPNP